MSQRLAAVAIAFLTAGASLRGFHLSFLSAPGFLWLLWQPSLRRDPPRQGFSAQPVREASGASVSCLWIGWLVIVSCLVTGGFWNVGGAAHAQGRLSAGRAGEQGGELRGCVGGCGVDGGCWGSRGGKPASQLCLPLCRTPDPA